MDPAVLFFLVLVAAALLRPQNLDGYPMAKPSTAWKNIKSRRSIGNHLVPDSGLGLLIDAGFYCVSSISPCNGFLFAASIEIENLSTQQIIWSANPDHPVRENATLEFTAHGNLVLRDADRSHVWSSNSGGRSVAGMLITEIGNLVLFDQRNSTVWESFKHPTDTWVLGQSLVEGMRLTTNTSSTNTTESQFYITVRPDGLYAFVESTPPQCYYKTLMGQYKTGHYPTEVTFMNGSVTTFPQPRWPDLDSNISLPTAVSTTQYMRLDFDGHLRLYEWSWSSHSWAVVYDVLDLDVCDYPTVCGEYGICTEGQCGCPLENNSSSSYFKMVDERKPNLGCAQITPISCEEIQHHRLFSIPNISYFDISYIDHGHTYLNATSIDDCKQACLKNCSCMAVLFTEYDMPNGQCVWLTKVFSLKSTQPDDYNSSAYLKVQLTPSNGNKEKPHLSPSSGNRENAQLSPSNENKKKVMLGATFGAVGTFVLLIIVVTFYLRRKKTYEEKDEEFDFHQLPGMPMRFSFETLRKCTEGFGKKLGEGGFGSVFEGKLGEDKVAVKRLEGARQGKKEFLAEVETIGSIEHINLVRLVGFCAEKSERLLVYEYVSRGSLDRWIYYRHNNTPLDWCTRCRIILDIAKGLCYLHEECRRKIAHLDIKPQNILLDNNFNAKVADFGLCKLMNRDQSKVVTVMRGTPGYLAPEWLTSRITEKVDVYSFGVVIMEIVSGRKNIDNSQPEENVQLINLLREKAQNNQLVDLIDKHTDDMVSHQEEVVQMMKLAIWCLQHDSMQRPSMSAVIKVLEGAMSIQTFDANSLMYVQDNPPTNSAPSLTSSLSGPR